MAALPPEVAAAVRMPDRALGPRDESGRRRYVLVETLGAGAFGTVWKAWDFQRNRFVALKVRQCFAPSLVPRFLREARLGSRLRHPNIVRVCDAGEQDGVLYMAADYVPGATLERLRLPLGRAVAVMRDVARTVQYAHDRGVIHRDLKPTNILLGEDGAPRILDFGLAHDTDASVPITREGAIVGTPAYMSPEQACGRVHAIDARTDVYGLGATLYSLVAGRAPFTGVSLAEVGSKVLCEEPPPLRDFVPDVPEALDGIVRKAMSKDPAARHATAEEFAAELDGLLEGMG